MADKSESENPAGRRAPGPDAERGINPVQHSERGINPVQHSERGQQPEGGEGRGDDAGRTGEGAGG